MYNDYRHKQYMNFVFQFPHAVCITLFWCIFIWISNNIKSILRSSFRKAVSSIWFSRQMSIVCFCWCLAVPTASFFGVYGHYKVVLCFKTNVNFQVVYILSIIKYTCQRKQHIIYNSNRWSLLSCTLSRHEKPMRKYTYKLTWTEGVKIVMQNIKYKRSK